MLLFKYSTNQIIIRVLEKLSFTFQPAASCHPLTEISYLPVLESQDIGTAEEPHLLSFPYGQIVMKHIATLLKWSQTESVE